MPSERGAVVVIPQSTIDAAIPLFRELCSAVEAAPRGAQTINVSIHQVAAAMVIVEQMMRDDETRETQLSALQQSREGMQRDAERYAWIADGKNLHRINYGAGFTGLPPTYSIQIGDRMQHFKTLDEAIDAALACTS